MVQPLYKSVWQFLTKLNIVLSYDLAIALLGIYPIDLKTYERIKYKLVVSKQSWDTKYSIGSIVNNIVITMYAVRWVLD